MVEIKWYARGGQGGFTASRLLGLASVRFAGGYAQAFPSFGPERRGAPVYGFTRLDEKPISDHSQLYRCDYAIVLDPTLMETIDVTQGLKEGGTLFINTADRDMAKRFPGVKTCLFDGLGAALKVMGSPISNTAMMTVAAIATGMADEAALEAAVEEGMPAKLVEKNIALIRYIAEKMQEELFVTEPEKAAGFEPERKKAAARRYEVPAEKPVITENYRFPQSAEELPFGPSSEAGVLTEGNAGWRLKKPVVDKAACIRCMRCWVLCPDGVINRDIEIDLNFCKGCGICAAECPKKAITMEREGGENA